MMSLSPARSGSAVTLVLIIAGVAMAAGAGMVAGLGDVSTSTLIRVPFAIGAIAIVFLTFRYFGLGVALLPAIATTVPIAIGTGTQSPIVAGLLFACLLPVIWAARAMVSRDFAFPRSPILAPSVLLTIVWIVTYLYSDVDRDPLVWTWDGFALPRLGQLGIVLISVVAMLLALFVGREVRWIQVATWSMVAVGCVGVIGFFPRFERITTIMNTGGLFTTWLVALAYGQALFNQELPGLARVGLVGLAIAWIYHAMFVQTIWFSGWLPAVVALATITLCRSRRAFALLFLAVASAVSLNYQQVYHALWDVKVAEGDLSRIPIWTQAWELTSQHLLLGTGPVGYAAYYTSIYAGSAFSMSTHSNYVDVVLETGLVGTVVFVWFLGALVVVGWRARRRWRAGFEQGFAEGAFGGLVGLIVAMQLGDWFIPFVYNQTIAGFRYTVHSWVLLGLLASLALIRPERAEA